MKATCQTCNTRHQVDRDEDGIARVPSVRCADPDCENRLCECCPRFHCAGCGGRFCLSHRFLVNDGTSKPLECCAACAGECEEIAPRPVHVAAAAEAIAAEVA